MKAIVFSVLVGVTALSGCATSSGQASASTPAEVEALKQQLADVQRSRQGEKSNLDNFDDLDFNVYSGQKWDQLTKSHSKDILVHYPDGHTTKGLDAHVDELKPMFAFAPDTKIKEHPVRIASGDWTAVSGVLEGTFSQPMPIGPGKAIPPTGKGFKLGMVTIGHWKDGVMTEEWLTWDNQTFMKQIGLAQ